MSKENAGHPSVFLDNVNSRVTNSKLLIFIFVWVFWVLFVISLLHHCPFGSVSNNFRAVFEPVHFNCPPALFFCFFAFVLTIFEYWWSFWDHSLFITASNAKIGVRMDENQLQILDDLPSSAVEMQVKDKVQTWTSKIISIWISNFASFDFT